MNTFALDFETYYDKDCSIKTLGPLGYFSHPNFDAYMVSVVGDEGTEYVGHPKDFNWSLLGGNRVLSHNASFDETLYLFGVKEGLWDSTNYSEWHCTADMCAYCNLPRSLKAASQVAFDLEVSKSTRDNMSGKRWENMEEDFKEEVIEYALKDSILCLDLWKKFEQDWPEAERLVSRINRTIVQRGIPINASLLKKQQEQITKLRFDTENKIPWINEMPVLSRKAFNEECRKHGIQPPASLALSSDEANMWIDDNTEEYPWVSSVRDYRRINSLKRKLDSFDYATMSDSRYYGGLMYMGAHTGRFSGSGGNLNLQNLPRGEMFGVDLRSLISTDKTHKLIVADLSQIEVRTLCWLSGDHASLKEIRETDDIYEAFAIRFGKWDKSKGDLKDENPKLRHMVKQMVLGCGYGASANKFAIISNMSVEEATKAVSLYRLKMNKVCGLWNRLQRKMHVAYSTNREFKLKLPSGRCLNYGKIKTVLQNGRRTFIASIYKGSKKVPVRLWGGLLAENYSQALAREVFADILVRIEKEGMKTIFHVHVEVIVEQTNKKAEDSLQKVLEIMKEPPTWIPDLPLDAEGKILKKYEK